MRFFTVTFLLGTLCLDVCAAKGTQHDPAAKTITISDPAGKLSISVDYSKGCKLSRMDVNGTSVLSPSGAWTGFRTRGGEFSSAMSVSEPQIVDDADGRITIRGIEYGDRAVKVNETWTFDTKDGAISWDIDRRYNTLAKLEDMSLPQWNFAGLDVWKGGIIDNGGMVWCKYLRNVGDTYGVHTGGVTFWNPESGDALRIATSSGDNCIATKFSHSDRGEFVCAHYATPLELEQRYNLDHFTGHPDVFAPFNVPKGDVRMHVEMEYVDYDKEYSRGNLPGIDAEAVRELMNTTGRYGVIDNGIVGANGWTTNWKCLHEPFFAQIGMALNDENYVRNMGASLDRERDYAVTDEGRVLSRWHNGDEDQMPGTYNYKTGYYEARWGYTVDSQTGFVIQTAEQFDLCGDVEWLRSHKETCEKVLGWLMARDSNGNGVFEMMNESMYDKTASDWLDVIWASFENAFVNAQMYEALNLWADCERVLGDNTKAEYYKAAARKMKETFNKPVEQGGFWSPEKKQYVYWRDKDGTPHGDNLVTPVNFAVIAFGLCDDKDRITLILDEIERRTAAEGLFHWPLCFETFDPGEASETQYPFPTYENGDIFPTWGYLGVRAYVNHDKQTALKYIRNILAQYKKDGLSSQRYSRRTQQGQGSDILAGICTSITALYRDIYGIRPRWNRMGLEPNMSKILNGTEFDYTLRGTKYHVSLRVDDYALSTDEFYVKSKDAFGASYSDGTLSLYPGNKDDMVIKISGVTEPVGVNLRGCTDKKLAWEMSNGGSYRYEIEGLDPSRRYTLNVGGKKSEVKVDKDGRASFECSKPDKTAIRLTAR